MATPSVCVLESSLLMFSAYTRIAVIVGQAVFNFLIPDLHNDMFIKPQEFQAKPVGDEAVSALLGGLSNWDGQYFLHIAEYGYTYENCLAFFPLFPYAVYFISTCMYWFVYPFLSFHSLLLCISVVINFACFLSTVKPLYQLTYIVTGSNRLALYSTLFFCVNPASIFFSATYSEALFCLLSIRGLLALERKNLWVAAIYFGLSGGTRSNGILYFGFILYSKLLELKDIGMNKLKKVTFVDAVKKGFSIGRCIFQTVVSGIISATPFIFYQQYAYRLFCNPKVVHLPSHVLNYGKDRRFKIIGITAGEWCEFNIPLSYSYVQQQYWDVGFLKYYMVKQIPNFILALPVALIILLGMLWYMRQNPQHCATMGLLTQPDSGRDTSWNSNGISGTKSFIYFAHATCLTAFGLLYINVQVLTRMLASSSPVLYWLAAACVTGKWNKEMTPEHLELERKLGMDLKQIGLYNIVMDELLTWRSKPRLWKVIVTYFLLYFTVGIILFPNGMPWT